MAAIDFAVFAHRAGLVFYLDTSALRPLALHEAAVSNSLHLTGVEQTRHARLTSFLDRVHRNSSRAICSVLALEELEQERSIRGELLAA